MSKENKRDYNFDRIKEHIGHSIECVGYGDFRDVVTGRFIENVAIECETCGEVLVDYTLEREIN